MKDDLLNSRELPVQDVTKYLEAGDNKRTTMNLMLTVFASSGGLEFEGLSSVKREDDKSLLADFYSSCAQQLGSFFT